MDGGDWVQWGGVIAFQSFITQENILPQTPPRQLYIVSGTEGRACRFTNNTNDLQQDPKSSFVNMHSEFAENRREKPRKCLETHTCECPSACLFVEVKRLLSVFLTDCKGAFSEGGREREKEGRGEEGRCSR